MKMEFEVEFTLDQEVAFIEVLKQGEILLHIVGIGKIVAVSKTETFLSPELFTPHEEYLLQINSGTLLRLSKEKIRSQAHQAAAEATIANSSFWKEHYPGTVKS
jgi:hypothetical protein